MPKYLAHVPVEQYGFVSVETETAEEAIAEYQNIKKLFTGGPGLPQKAFNAWYDQYRTTGRPGSADEWAEMSAVQKDAVNELKKSLKRNKEQGIVNEAKSITEGDKN